MTVGILCESQDDFEVFSILIKRLLEQEIQIERFIPYPAEGSIMPKLEAASIKFFKVYLHDSERADFAVYFSDRDGTAEKRQNIIKWITQHRKDNPERPIVAAFAEPHFEQWFITEEDCLRSVLRGLPTPLPFSDAEPKEQLRKIIINYSDLDVSGKEVRMELAEVIHLGSLKRRDGNFKSFAGSLLTTLREAQTLQKESGSTKIRVPSEGFEPS